MTKRSHTKRSHKKTSKKGGYVGEGVVQAVSSAGENVVQGAEGLGKKTTGWWGSLWGSSQQAPAPAPAPAPATAPTVAPAPAPAVAPVEGQTAGSRRRRRHKRTRGILKGFMSMFDSKTKKRRQHGGIGGSQGYQQLVGANFPSAANPQGNNIYNLGKFNPYKPMTGGYNMNALTPGEYGTSYLLGGKKTKRHHKRRSNKRK